MTNITISSVEKKKRYIKESRDQNYQDSMKLEGFFFEDKKPLKMDKSELIAHYKVF